MVKQFIIAGGLLSMAAVLIGAFGAHALEPTLKAYETLDTFRTGVTYHTTHALALLAVGILLRQFGEHKLMIYAGYLFLAGIVLFSGSLYAYSITDIRALAMITPFGGACYIIGWLLFTIAAGRLIRDR